MIRLETLGRKVRELYYYKVEVAGAQIGLKRSQSYEAAQRGLIPTEQDGKLLLVPRQKWDRKVKRLLRGRRSI